MLNRAAQSTKTSAFYGELLKRFKSAVLKTARSERARAFESHIPRHSTLRIGVLGIASKYMRNRYVGLAQLVERRADNAEVLGSIPKIYTKVSKVKRDAGSETATARRCRSSLIMG